MIGMQMTQVKNLLKRGALIAGAFLMVTQLWAQSNTTTDVVTTESGQVKGAVKDGVLAFKGIPFAASPLANCAGAPRNRSLHGPASARPPSMPRTARSFHSLPTPRHSAQARVKTASI